MVKLRLTNRNNQFGYTLLEVLIVLSILMMFLSISMSRYHFQDTSEPLKEFLNQFEQDVFYYQQRAATYQTLVSITLSPSENRYYIRDSTQQPNIIIRDYPPDLKIYLGTLKNPIQFNSNGTILNPGDMIIYYKSNEYKIKFPFGKGRFYVTEKS